MGRATAARVSALAAGPAAPEIVRSENRRSDGMDAGGDLLMRVEGMTCDGCAAAVRRIVRRIDPAAEVEVDRAHERVAIRTSAQSLILAEALTGAGYTATAMTG